MGGGCGETQWYRYRSVLSCEKPDLPLVLRLELRWRMHLGHERDPLGQTLQEGPITGVMHEIAYCAPLFQLKIPKGFRSERSEIEMISIHSTG